MKKINSLFIGLVSLVLMTTSCEKKPEYPENPKDGQVYKDASGNTGVWNAMLGYWVISSMVNGRSVQHHYYPSKNTYTTTTGAPVSRSQFTRTTSPGSTRSSGFGTIGRGSSAAS